MGSTNEANSGNPPYPGAGPKLRRLPHPHGPALRCSFSQNPPPLAKTVGASLRARQVGAVSINQAGAGPIKRASMEHCSPCRDVQCGLSGAEGKVMDPGHDPELKMGERTHGGSPR